MVVPGWKLLRRGWRVGGLKRPKWRIAPPAAGCRAALTSNVAFEGVGEFVSDGPLVVIVPVSEGWPPPWT